jgi:hypothetical protein
MRAAALAILLVACGGAQHAVSTAPRDDHHGGTGEIVGITSRAEIESEFPAWREQIASTTFDADAAERLASVPPGAEVDVFLGTWCGDSRREIARLFRALERAETAGPLPFTIRFVAVDRAKTAPGLTEGVGLRYVPTIVVRRDGAEVGRIVEMANPEGVDRTLLGLLDGTRSGPISSSRHDL